MPTALTKDANRQQLIVASVVIALANLTSAADLAVMQLPAGAVILGGDIVATEAFDSTSTDVLDVGDGASQNRYLNDGSVHTAIRTALVPTGYKYTAPTDLTVRWVSGGGSPTTGKVRLTVMYYVIGRGQFTQG